jgi:hypothetical protein
VKVFLTVMLSVLEEGLNGHLLVWIIWCTLVVQASGKSGIKHCLGLAFANSLHHSPPEKNAGGQVILIFELVQRLAVPVGTLPSLLQKSSLFWSPYRVVLLRVWVTPSSFEVECVAQLASRFVCNAFELHAGMELIRTVTFGEISGNDHQRPCTRRINQCSEVGIRLLPRLCPSLRAASKTASRSTKWLVVSATKCSADSEDGRGMCALVSCSACSLSSINVLTPQRRIQLPEKPSPRLCHEIPGDGPCQSPWDGSGASSTVSRQRGASDDPYGGTFPVEVPRPQEGTR